MEVKFTTTQRLQLYYLLGAQRGPVAHIRKCAKLMDKLELTEAERDSISLRVDVNGVPHWGERADTQIAVAEITADEAALIKGLLENTEIRPVDLKWVEPVLEQVG